MLKKIKLSSLYGKFGKNKFCCQGGQFSVYYNRYNNVIQCHQCGHVYVKASKLDYLLNRIFKWWGN